MNAHLNLKKKDKKFLIIIEEFSRGRNQAGQDHLYKSCTIMYMTLYIHIYVILF